MVATEVIVLATTVKHMIPERLLRRRLPSAAGRAVLLTFDDGPTTGVTEGVLDRLDAVGARAVFFLLGRKIPAAPGLPAEILERGHLLGNHSHDHDSRRWQAPGFWRSDLRRCSDLIVQYSGAPCRFYRPPEGKITPLTLLGPPAAGLQHVQWSLDSDDWSARSADEARARGRDAADRAAAGDIILCHDFDAVVHEMLDVLLPRLVDAGFDLAAGCAALPGGEAP